MLLLLVIYAHIGWQGPLENCIHHDGMCTHCYWPTAKFTNGLTYRIKSTDPTIHQMVRGGGSGHMKRQNGWCVHWVASPIKCMGQAASFWPRHVNDSKLVWPPGWLLTPWCTVGSWKILWHGTPRKIDTFHKLSSQLARNSWQGLTWGERQDIYLCDDTRKMDACNFFFCLISVHEWLFEDANEHVCGYSLPPGPVF